METIILKELKNKNIRFKLEGRVITFYKYDKKSEATLAVIFREEDFLLYNMVIDNTRELFPEDHPQVRGLIDNFIYEIVLGPQN